MTNMKEELIQTVDENGNNVKFELIDIVSVDDIEYALLLPKEQEEQEEEILVMRIKKQGEDYSFEVIEDDEEFNKVTQYIEELEDELDE